MENRVVPHAPRVISKPGRTQYVDMNGMLPSINYYLRAHNKKWGSSQTSELWCSMWSVRVSLKPLSHYTDSLSREYGSKNNNSIIWEFSSTAQGKREIRQKHIYSLLAFLASEIIIYIFAYYDWVQRSHFNYLYNFLKHYIICKLCFVILYETRPRVFFKWK